jgi:hypothetical protein
VIAKLHIADLLAAGPMTIDELAGATGAHLESLRRLLRALARFGVASRSRRRGYTDARYRAITGLDVVFQIKCRNFSFLLLKSISSASKLRQWQAWRTEICAAKIWKFGGISEKSAASAKYLKNLSVRP